MADQPKIITLTCKCGKRLKAPVRQSTTKVKCPHCGCKLLLPQASSGTGPETRGAAPPNGERRRCPECRTEYDKQVKVCVACGIDLTTGKPLLPAAVLPSPDLDDEPDEDDDDETEVRPSKGRVAAAWIAAYMPGLFRPVLLTVAIFFMVVGLVIVGTGILLLLGFMVVLEGGVCIALGSLAYAQGLALILMGDYLSLVDALVEFDWIHWAIWFVCLLLPGAVLIMIAPMMAN